MGVLVSNILSDKLFLGFLTGACMTLLVTGFILSKDPRHVPLILRYSLHDSFLKIAPRDHRGVIQMAFSEFIHIYTQIRILFLLSFIAFCAMVATVAVLYKPV